MALALATPLAVVRAQQADASGDVQATIRAAQSQGNPGMLEQAARQAEDQIQWETARKLLDAALALRESQGSGSGAVLVQLGDLERRRGDAQQARQFYEQAVRALGDTREAAPAIIELGVQALTAKDPEGAFQQFERASVLEPEDGWPLLWMAVARREQGDQGEADRLFRNGDAG
jgi:tetratricopeptide (TPR) repeat protein